MRIPLACCLSCVRDVGWPFFFSSFPFFDFDLYIVCFILTFSCGYYAVSSVSGSAATCLAYDMYPDTCVGWYHLFIFVWGRIRSVSVKVIISSAFYLFSSSGCFLRGIFSTNIWWVRRASSFLEQPRASYEEYFQEIFLSKILLGEYFAKICSSTNISSPTISRAADFSQQILGGMAVTSKHVGWQGLNPLTDSRRGTLHTETSILRIKRPWRV